MRRLGVLCVYLLLVVACDGSAGGDEAASTTPPSIAPTTSIPSTTTTVSEPTSTTTGTSSEPSPTSASPVTGDSSGPVPGATAELQADGLGLIDFGAQDNEVVALLEMLVGSPPTDPGDEAGWVKYVGWNELGLFLGFSQPEWSDYDGVSRLVGWQYGGTAAELDLRTARGAGVGTTTPELRAIYGDDLVVPTEPDECGGLGVQLLGDDEGIVAHLDDTGVVKSLAAGLQVGC